MFPIVVNDGTAEFPDADIYYIVCKEGVYLKKRLGVMESIAPVKNISILQSVQAMAKMHIKKIPAKTAQEIINFFKAVYQEHYAEAIVLLFYNQESKQYKVVCPHQEVSGGAADYNKGIVIEGFDMIGTIHSHAGMSAFHSGVDDKDEESFDGLHITFGNMRDEDISISASIVANGFRVIVDPREYINQLELTVDIDEEVKIPYAQTWKWNKDKNKMVEVQTNKFYTRKNFDQRYKVRLAKDPKFNPQWMERVKKKTYTYAGYGGGNYWQGWRGKNKGNSAYESSYWHGWTGHGQVNNKNLPAVIGASGAVIPAPPTKPVPPTTKPSATPCDDCTFKHHKVGFMLDQLTDQDKKEVLAWALEQLNESADYVMTETMGGDDFDLTHYHCTGCGGRFSVDESKSDLLACCPSCKVDDYLTEISSMEMMMTDAEYAAMDFSSDGEQDASSEVFVCSDCGSSFSKDFLNSNGDCPVCGKIVAPRQEVPVRVVDDYDEDDGFVQCPECKRHLAKVSLNFSKECRFCSHLFTDLEINNGGAIGEEALIQQSAKDSGDFLDPNRQAIEAAIEADKDLERIPVPEKDSTPINKPKKPGIFASLFNRSK